MGLTRERIRQIEEEAKKKLLKKAKVRTLADYLHQARRLAGLTVAGRSGGW